MLLAVVDMERSGQLSFSLRLAAWHNGEGDVL